MLFRSTKTPEASPSFALKGHTIVAQGNALGIGGIWEPSPEHPHHHKKISHRPEGAAPFIHQPCTDREIHALNKTSNQMEAAASGLVLRGVGSFPRAMPWAGMGRPFRAGVAGGST